MSTGAANLISIATASGENATHVAEKYGFTNASCDVEEIINDFGINTVFIATRHNTHYDFVMGSLQNDKNVFVEKPLCMYEEELEEIRGEYATRKSHLMVGFNRRFAPQIQEIIKHMGHDTVKAINYRVNLGRLEPDHWTQDPEIGCGRIIGEV